MKIPCPVRHLLRKIIFCYLLFTSSTVSAQTELSACTISGPGEICNEGSAGYTASFAQNGMPVQYSWQLLNNTAGAKLEGRSSGATKQAQTDIKVIPAHKNFITSGSYTLQLTLRRGATTTKCIYTVAVNNLSVAINGGYTGGEPASPQSSYSLTLNAITTGGTGGYSYQWTVTDDITELPNTDWVTFSDPASASTTVIFSSEPYGLIPAGTYKITVRVTDASGCTTSATYIIHIPTEGGKPILPDKTIRIFDSPSAVFSREPLIYPNPSNGMFSIKLAEWKYTRAVLFDITGRVVFKKDITSEKTDLFINQAGVYTLQLTELNRGRQYIKKIVVQK